MAVRRTTREDQFLNAPPISLGPESLVAADADEEFHSFGSAVLVVTAETITHRRVKSRHTKLDASTKIYE